MAFARARTVARNLHQSLNRRPFSTASPSQGAAARAASKRAFQLGIGAGAVLTVGGVAVRFERLVRERGASGLGSSFLSSPSELRCAAQTYLYTQSPVFLDAPSPLPVKQRRRDRSLTAAEVAKHNSKGDLWVVIDSQVWECVLSPEGAVCVGARLELTRRLCGDSISDFAEIHVRPSCLRSFC